MALDFVLFAIFGAFVALGVWRGALKSGAGLICLALGYAAAILCATHFGDVVGHQLGLEGVVASMVAGSLGFFGVFGLATLAAGWLAYFERTGRVAVPERADRVIGGAFGALRGALVVTLVAWVVSWADAARDLGGNEALAVVPDAGASHVAGLSSVVVEQAVNVALDGDAPTTRVAARIAARPQTALGSVQALMENPLLQDVSEDKHFWTLVMNGASESALNRGSFYRITHDEALRTQFADLGLVSHAAAGSSEAFRDELRVVLDEVGPRVKAIRDDPALERLAQDPEIQDLVASGNTFALVQHPKVRALAKKAAESI